MARLWMSGGEWNAAGEFSSIDSQITVGATAQKRSGTYSLALTGTTGNANYGFTQNLPSTLTEGYIKGCIRRDNYSLGNSDFINWLKTGSGLGFVRINTSGQLQIYTNGVLRATGTKVLAINTWYVIEAYVLISATGTITVRVDGLQDVTWSGDTRAGALVDFDQVRYTMYRHASTASNSYMDDFAVNDTTGSSNNSWIGEGSVILLSPTAAGANSAWTAQGAVNNWDCVEEIPPDDATTYVYTNAAANKDSYNIANMPGGVGTILAVQLDSWLLKTTGSTPQNVKQMIISGATTAYSANISPGTSFGIYHKVWDVDPADSAAWTSADIDALEIGVESAA